MGGLRENTIFDAVVNSYRRFVFLNVNRLGNPACLARLCLALESIVDILKCTNVPMPNLGKVPHTWIIACIAFVLGLIACKSESSAPMEMPFLSAPTVLVPVGTLRQPQGIAVDATGRVWVADTRAGKVRRFDAGGTQLDSVAGFQSPTRMGRDRSNNDLLVIDRTTISRITPATGHVTIIATLNAGSVTGSSVFDVNTRTSSALTVDVQRLGDISGSLTGDLFVTAFGTPENFLVRVRGGLAEALAASHLAPPSAGERDAHFCAVDGFGTVFTSFILDGTLPTIRLYAYNSSNPDLGRVLPEPLLTGAAHGSDIDATGILYITDPATQELIVVSTTAERTVARYPIPDIGGYSMMPHDVAVANDGKVYVVVNDRSGSEAGAVLRYERSSR